MVTQNMNYSQNGVKFTEREEGLRLVAYLDIRGKPTIGYGHTTGVHMGMRCTQQKAEEWLVQDVQTAVDAVNRLVTVQLTQQEFDALVDFTYNLGQRRLSESTLLVDLNSGDFGAAAKQFEAWVYCDGKYMASLFNRRVREERLFTTEPEVVASAPAASVERKIKS